MATNSTSQIRHIYDDWHKMITTRNLEGLMEFYAEDGVLESSAILVIEKKPEGILRGKRDIARHFGAFFRMMGKDVPDWYRFEPMFTDGKLLIWEYPSKGPKGAQLDVVESFDIESGLIVYHRVYWGWRGFQFLNGAG